MATATLTSPQRLGPHAVYRRTRAPDNSVLASHYNTRHGSETDFSRPIRPTPSATVPRRSLFHFLRACRALGHPEKKFTPSLFNVIPRARVFSRYAPLSVYLAPSPSLSLSLLDRHESSRERLPPNKNLTNAIADAKKPLSSAIVPRYLLTFTPSILPPSSPMTKSRERRKGQSKGVREGVTPRRGRFVGKYTRAR